MKDYKLTKWNKTSQHLIDKYLFIFAVCLIDDPKFDSQAKETLTTKTKDLEQFTIPKSVCSAFYTKIKVKLNDQFLANVADTEVKKKKKTTAKKYEAAENAGTKKSKQCSLFIPEGDSAEQFIRKGLTDKKAGMGGFLNYGIFNIQGKPTNARKEITIKYDSSGKKVIIRSDKLKGTKIKSGEMTRWNTLIEILGLDYTYTYDDTEVGQKQYDKLNYGQIIVAVDQDSDGVGHIFGLILNFFHVFWANLIKRGFIKRLATPIIRAFPDKSSLSVQSFYSEADYEKWCIKNFGCLTAKGYKIEFYKGLAGHEDEGVIDIFKKFKDYLYTYTIDNLTDELFETYFGKVTINRKIELKTSPVEYNIVANKITCTQQLRYETKNFFRDDIIRSLPHSIDGLRPAARLILAGARKEFKSNNSLQKVYQLGGSVTKSMHYHHGDMSLNANIIRMGQKFPGACNIPFLNIPSQSGSRSRGGKDAGAARYLSVNLNSELVNALFPPVDDFLLKYNYDDGERCEPLYYVPVIPLALLESFTIPATGWKCVVWAREYKSVIKNIRNLIHGKPLQFMPYWNNYNSSTIIEGTPITKSSKITMIGDYKKIDKNTLQITELPAGIWSADWKDSYIDDENIIDITNNSSDYDIDIKVVFKDGFLFNLEDEDDTPEGIDPIVKYLNLYSKDTHLINLLDVDNNVVEYDNYEEVLKDWFKVRKALYTSRIERRSIQLRWYITMYENLIRYVENYQKYDIKGKSMEEVSIVLRKNNYVELNQGHLENPAYCKTEELENYILENKSYNYLNIREFDKLDKPNQKRKKELEEFRQELEHLNTSDTLFKGANIWLEELRIAEEVIDKFHASKWVIGKPPKY